MTQAAPPIERPITPRRDPAAPMSFWPALARRPSPPRLPTGLDAAWNAVAARLVQAPPRRWWLLRQAQHVLVDAQALRELSTARLQAECRTSKAIFRRGRDRAADRHRALALVVEVARRELGMTPYPVQIAAAVGLSRGYLVEMATGEGKTLVAALAATLLGWRGRGVHVLTSNDYLAGRDAKLMAPLYRFAGLSVASVDQEMKPPDRRAAYAADITTLTSKEAAADHLRDKLALGKLTHLTPALIDGLGGGRSVLGSLVMRGLAAAVVDEADSLLIDEAVTPLILSQEVDDDQQRQAFVFAAELAELLEERRHYRVVPRFREVDLTAAGRARLAELCRPFTGLWQSARLRDEMVTQALTARHLFERDKHYIIEDGKVVIVDDATGRLMPDRTWRAGLHQAVEAREGLTITAPKITLARISFQRFFRGYRHLCGMTGTGYEARHEFFSVYRAATVRVPTHRPCIRRLHGLRLLRHADERWQAVVHQAQQVCASGRPVLIGTRSVEASEAVSRLLSTSGLEHQVLNAVRHAEEASMVARAGEAGRITVATNMAGRGTDIKLGAGVAEAGGLHVIAAEPNLSRRIDRQLFGRAGRQGDPGSAAAFAALDDELLRRYADPLSRRLLHSGSAMLASWGLRRCQSKSEKLGRQTRQQVLRHDHQLEDLLGFAGREH